MTCSLDQRYGMTAALNPGRQECESINLFAGFYVSHQLELDGKVGCVHMLLSPDQITHLTDLLAALCIDTGTQIHRHNIC